MRESLGPHVQETADAKMMVGVAVGQENDPGRNIAAHEMTREPGPP